MNRVLKFTKDLCQDGNNFILILRKDWEERHTLCAHLTLRHHFLYILEIVLTM